MEFYNITAPIAFLQPEIMQGFISYNDIFNIFGKEHSDDPENKFNEAGPTREWLIGYKCGIKLYLQHHYHGLLVVYANNYESEHIIKHIPMLKNMKITHEKSFNEKAGTIEKSLLNKYKLVRLDSYGNEFTIVKNISFYDAQCRMFEFERIHHNQSFHVEIDD